MAIGAGCSTPSSRAERGGSAAARALISRSLVLLRDRGMTSAQLGVDAENPNAALHLYESSGFRVDHSGSAWRKDWDLSRG